MLADSDDENEPEALEGDVEDALLARAALGDSDDGAVDQEDSGLFQDYPELEQLVVDAEAAEHDAMAAAMSAKRKKDAVKKLRGHLRPTAAGQSRSLEEKKKAIDALKRVSSCSACRKKGHWHKDKECPRYGKPPLPRPKPNTQRTGRPGRHFDARYVEINMEEADEELPSVVDEQCLFAATDTFAMEKEHQGKRRIRRGGKRGTAAAAKAASERAAAAQLDPISDAPQFEYQ